MRVELLYIADCQNHAVAAHTLRETLRERGLPDTVSEILVTDRAQAETLAFPGSPTIRIDGSDIEGGLLAQRTCSEATLFCRPEVAEGSTRSDPQAEGTSGIRSAAADYGLSCRTYMVDGKRQGVPSTDMIREAIGAATKSPRRRDRIMKHLLAMAPAGAVVSSLSATACCLPLGISAAAGAVGLSVMIEPLRPWLIALSLSLLVLGFVSLYRSKGTCRPRSRARIYLFWFSAIVVVAAVLFPQILAGFLADVVG
jgi:hypothetical protein